jgi:type IV fimbrial biogenesis protein FimT
LPSRFPRHFCCRQPGLTLIEQIVVIAVAAVLAGLALPSLKRLLAGNQTRIAQTDLMSVLNRARALAVEAGRATVACPTRDAAQCSDESSWNQGWLVGFRGERSGQIDGPPGLYRENRSSGVAIFSTLGRRSVQFQPDGSAGGSNLTLLICRRRGDGDQALHVTVSNAGRVRGGPASADQAQACATTD